MTNAQALLSDTQPIPVIRDTHLRQRPTSASTREEQPNHTLSAFSRLSVTRYAGLEAMRQFAEMIRKMP